MCALLLLGCNRANVSSTSEENNETESESAKDVIWSETGSADIYVAKSIGDIQYSVPESWSQSEYVNPDGVVMYSVNDALFMISESEYISKDFNSQSDVGQQEIRYVMESNYPNNDFSDFVDLNGVMGYRVNAVIDDAYMYDRQDVVIFAYNYNSYIAIMGYAEEDQDAVTQIFDNILNSITFAGSTEQGAETVQESLPYQMVGTPNEPFFSYSGSGDDVVFATQADGLSYAKITYGGERNFSVKGHHDDTYDLLVNTIGSYEGTVMILPNTVYMFEVGASGEWTIELYKNQISDTDSFSGNGDYVTPLFLKSSDVYEITSTGEGHFAIKAWNEEGYDLLVNTIDDDYSGRVIFSGEGYSFFEITSERKWEIKPVQ